MDMTFETALAHAGPLNEVPAEITSELRAEFPYYLWIDDQYAPFDGWNEVQPGRQRRMVCELCESDWVDARRAGGRTYPQG